MKRFIWAAFSALICASAIYGASPSQAQPHTQGLIKVASSQSQTMLSAQKAYEGAAQGKMVLLDIRSPQEWKQTGLPRNGHAVTVHQPWLSLIHQIEKATNYDKTKPIALICASGVRSTKLYSFLQKAGYQNLYNVAEGMTGGPHGPGWIKAGLPIRPYSKIKTK